MADDVQDLKRTLRSIKFRHIVIIGLIAGGLWLITRIDGLNVDNTDRSDYKAVAETFIRDSAVIAQKLGRVGSLSHKGAGGGAGRVSYNVYSVKGEDDTGVCYLTLRRDDDDQWYVTEATLMVGGSEYTIPIRRNGGKDIKVF